LEAVYWFWKFLVCRKPKVLSDIQERGSIVMSQEMNRRDFLKASAVTGAWIWASDLFYTDPIAYGAVTIPEAEKITITSIIDNYDNRKDRSSYKIANRIRAGYLHAEHALSCHIETVVNGSSHSLLFDFGRTFEALSRNIDTLGIDLDKLEVLVLSHGHGDHYGGLVELLESGKIPKGIPLYVGEEAFAESGIGERVAHRPPKKEDVESLGVVKIIEVKDPTPIVSGANLTGRIERVTEYEKAEPGRWVKIGDTLRPETFIGEQALVLNLKGKGLVVLTGCGHVGVVNTVKHAQKISGVKKVHAVMGGFHLTGAKKELIQRTVADIKAMAPDYVVPMHCTGFEAVGEFAREMPNQFILNTVGTRYIFSRPTV
jgi:7,8-dihydropterin-6-yl-methyl-4-(beta-D-ribofuranosyl)aminobenzene 5'-phosphate synthase